MSGIAMGSIKLAMSLETITYENVKRDRLFYPKTTEKYKEMIEERIESYKLKKK